jgi:hypothetical protein
MFLNYQAFLQPAADRTDSALSLWISLFTPGNSDSSPESRLAASSSRVVKFGVLL